MNLLKPYLTQLKAHPNYDRTLHWGKLITITGSAQVIVQAVGFLSGILVIRLLPVEEYALYTLANTMLGTMTVLADGGISTGVMVQGGEVWQDKQKLGAVLATGLDLQRKFAIGSLLVSIPILLYLLLHHGATWLTATMIVLSLIPAFYAALSDSLLEIVPKLHQSILPLQKNQVSVGIGRLLFSALTLFVFPWTFVAILASGIPRIYGNIKLKNITFRFINKAKPDITERTEILKLVRRTMPGLIYYCVSGQITIWILSLFGNTTSMAQIGALGRISMLLSIVSVLISTILTPRFARLPNNRDILSKRFLQMFLIVLIFCFLFILAVYLLSSQILWVLGESYSNLNLDLIFSIIGSCIFYCAGFIYSLTSCRGFVLSPYIYITGSIIAIISGVILFDISSLRGILVFNVYVALIQLLMYIAYSYIKLFKR